MIFGVFNPFFFLRVKYKSFNGRINYKLYWGRIDDQVCEVCENHTRYKGIKPNIEYIDRMGWIDSQVYERVKYSEI